MTNESLIEFEQENEGLTDEEREKQKEELLKRLEECKPFKDIISHPSWDKVKETLKDDIVLNLHFSKDSEFYHLCWGIKMTIERMEARGKAVADIESKLMEL